MQIADSYSDLSPPVPANVRLTFDEIKAGASQRFDIAPDSVCEHTRASPILEARLCAMYLASIYCGVGYERIGRTLGGYTKTSVHNSVHKVRQEGALHQAAEEILKIILEAREVRKMGAESPSTQKLPYRPTIQNLASIDEIAEFVASDYGVITKQMKTITLPISDERRSWQAQQVAIYVAHLLQHNEKDIVGYFQNGSAQLIESTITELDKYVLSDSKFSAKIGSYYKKLSAHVAVPYAKMECDLN